MHKLQTVPKLCICDVGRPSASNSLPSADYPFGAKSQYGPTVTSTRHPEPYEGHPATIDPMPVPLQRAAVSVRPVNMSTTWPVHDRLTMAACPMIRPCLQRMRFSGAATSCDVSSRTIRTSEAENTFTSCLPGLDPRPHGFARPSLSGFGQK